MVGISGEGAEWDISRGGGWYMWMAMVQAAGSLGEKFMKLGIEM